MNAKLQSTQPNTVLDQLFDKKGKQKFIAINVFFLIFFFFSFFFTLNFGKLRLFRFCINNLIHEELWHSNKC